MKYIISILVLFIGLNQVSAQDLLGERIRRITSRKKSIYLDKGIFHNGGPTVQSNLKTVRHNYNKRLGYERIVFDFKTAKIPKVYGHINSPSKNLYVDLFDTQIDKNVGSFGKTQFVDSINFFPISRDTLSVELKFKEKVSVDIFYLENPGRLVIDIKR
jgi:hypothetical protein